MKRELFVSSKFNPKTLPQDYICVLSRAKFALYLAVTSRGRFSWGGDFFLGGGWGGGGGLLGGGGARGCCMRRR